ncbi:MAG: hypothetical protein AAGI01_08240 [Myxococcota bacterium]
MNPEENKSASWTLEEEDALLGLTPESAVSNERARLARHHSRSPQAHHPRVESSFRAAKDPIARDFWEELFAAPTTILDDGGWVTIAMYTGWSVVILTTWVLGFQMFPLRMLVLTPFFLFLALGVPLAYLMHVTQQSAHGSAKLHEFPDTDNAILWILSAVFRCGFLLFICYGPSLHFAMSGHMELSMVLGAIGSFYYPMGWMCMCISDSVVGALPHVVIPAIVKMFVPHLVLFGIIEAMGAVGRAVVTQVDTTNLDSLPLLCFMAMTNIYIGYVWAFLVGRVYYHYEYLEEPPIGGRGGIPQERYTKTAAIALTIVVVGAGLFSISPRRVHTDASALEMNAQQSLEEQEFHRTDPALDRGVDVYHYWCSDCHSTAATKAPTAPKMGAAPFKDGAPALQRLIDEAKDGCFDSSTGLIKRHDPPEKDLRLAIRYMIMTSTPKQ